MISRSQWVHMDMRTSEREIFAYNKTKAVPSDMERKWEYFYWLDRVTNIQALQAWIHM